MKANKMKKKDNGIVLIPLTLLAIGVMRWAREDLKMVGAAATNINTQQYSLGILQKTLTLSGLSTKISALTSSATTTLSVTDNDNTVVSVPLSLTAETTCRRKENATSTNVISHCRYASTTHSNNYLKNNQGSLTTVMGIEQPLITATTSE